MHKLLKQEFIFIPLLLLLIEGLRCYLVTYYPDTALFDRGSELESFVFRTWQMVWITSVTWLLLRVIFPAAYYELKNYYFSFHQCDAKERREVSLRLYLIVFLGLLYLIGKGQSGNIRHQLLINLSSQTMVREATGNNDGKEVETYLAYVHAKKGDAWCAAYVSYNYAKVGILPPINPKTAWSPRFADARYVICSKTKHIRKPEPGDCFTLYYTNLKRVGHVGFIVAVKDSYYLTNEGNTGSSGSRDGQGVHVLKRSKAKIYTISDYISPHEKHLSVNSSAVVYSLSIKKGKYNERSFAKSVYAYKRKLYRLNAEDQRAVSQFNRYSSERQQWSHKHAIDTNRNIRNVCKWQDSQWPSDSRLCVQGPGGSGKAQAETYRAFTIRTPSDNQNKRNNKVACATCV